jgi:hypothetical protein
VKIHLSVTTFESRGRKTSSQVPLLMRAPYSSSIAARQLGSASAARTEDGIGDDVEVVKVNGFVAIRKPSLALVTIL